VSGKSIVALDVSCKFRIRISGIPHRRFQRCTLGAAPKFLNFFRSLGAIGVDARRAGSQSGNGISETACLPRMVCLSRSRASREHGKSAAARIRAGHRRSCTNVILPSTSRHTNTCGAARTERVTAKMVRDIGCDHQLPRTASPAIASTRQGIPARRTASQTTPWRSTNASACAGVRISVFCGARVATILRRDRTRAPARARARTAGRTSGSDSGSLRAAHLRCATR